MCVSMHGNGMHTYIGNSIQCHLRLCKKISYSCQEMIVFQKVSSLMLKIYKYLKGTRKSTYESLMVAPLQFRLQKQRQWDQYETADISTQEQAEMIKQLQDLPKKT